VGVLRAYVTIALTGFIGVNEVAALLDVAVGELVATRGGLGGAGGTGRHTPEEEETRGVTWPSPPRCVVVPVLAASFDDVGDAGMVLELTAVA